jgi:hypothetical protein
MSLSFEKLAELVVAANRQDRRISCIYHPDPPVASIDTAKFGGIRVAKGPYGYQLVDGTMFSGETFYDAAG